MVNLSPMYQTMTGTRDIQMYQKDAWHPGIHRVKGKTYWKTLKYRIPTT